MAARIGTSRAIWSAGAASRRHYSRVHEAQQSWNGKLVFSEEVEEALVTGRPVVALESTIITHGMPRPTNLATARSVESIIHSHSAIPATIALLDGKVHVGLSDGQLSKLAEAADDKHAVKTSRRDIAPVLAMRRTGGTTVAGTMYVAATVGIDVFVTGGIGGVHRGAENSMDISADLIELGKTPVAVVCAGAKSILDIPRTLEYLETQGVCVATYGPTTDFPAFYHPRSGAHSPWNAGSPATAAKLIHTGLTLPAPLSTLLTVPIPAEHTDDGAQVQNAVEQAVRESVDQGIDRKGKEVTPWLLKRVGELSGGLALRLNVKLIENNASVGAQVAREVAALRRGAAAGPQSRLSSRSLGRRSYSTAALPQPFILIIGSAAMDITSSVSGTLVPRTTTSGRIRLTPGGVGRNIAEETQRLLPPNTVQLVSVIGSQPNSGRLDTFSELLLQELDRCGLRTDGLIRREGRTATCSLILSDRHDLVHGVADMGIIETMTPEEIHQAISISAPNMVAFDCNLSVEAIVALLDTCRQRQIPTFCDPTSTEKCQRLVEALSHLKSSSPDQERPFLTHVAPNEIELELMARKMQGDQSSPPTATAETVTEDSLVGWASALHGLVQEVWATCGPKGAYQISLSAGRAALIRHLRSRPVPPSEIISTTGAGDTFSGGLIAALASQAGMLTAEWEQRIGEQITRTLKSHRAVG